MMASELFCVQSHDRSQKREGRGSCISWLATQTVVYERLDLLGNWGATARGADDVAHLIQNLL